MRHAVRDAFDEATADWATKVVVLDSANPKFFSGGMDIKTSNPLDFEATAVPNYGSWMGASVPGDLPLRRPGDRQGPRHCGGRRVPVRRVLADFAIAADTAQFGQYEIKVGAVGGPGIMRRMMSEQAARY